MAARRTATAAPGGDTESSPLDAFCPLDELMPWSVRPLRTGRTWVSGPDPAALRARWERLAAAGAEERERLFAPTRSRTPHTSVAALPGHSTGTARFARAPGPCPDPVRVLHGPYDEQWLLPDHRLIDAARPELWRVADGRQLFAVEHGAAPEDSGPALSVTALLPDGYSPAGRPGPIRPLFRRPGGTEANLAPGLPELLRGLGGGADPDAFTPEAVLAWVLAAARPSPAGPLVPLPGDGEVWAAGVALGRELTRLQTRGARDGERPRLPGGRRPYVRAALPARPGELSYDADNEALTGARAGSRRCPRRPGSSRWAGCGCWSGGSGSGPPRRRGLRTDGEVPDGLDAVGARGWTREWTSELLELITVLALVDGAAGRREELAARLDAGPLIGPAELRSAGVLPAPARSRLPASVLGHQEEGPDGQFALL